MRKVSKAIKDTGKNIYNKRVQIIALIVFSSGLSRLPEWVQAIFWIGWALALWGSAVLERREKHEETMAKLKKSEAITDLGKYIESLTAAINRRTNA